MQLYFGRAVVLKIIKTCLQRDFLKGFSSGPVIEHEEGKLMDTLEKLWADKDNIPRYHWTTIKYCLDNKCADCWVVNESG